MVTALTNDAGCEIPLICGAMYPCSNPELVAAVSLAGGLGIIQPISLTYVHGHDFRQGIRLIRQLTTRPVGMNALIEQSSRSYRERMERWIHIALEEGVRFFVTSLGNPAWVVKLVEPEGGIVYHDVTEKKWAEKGVASGARGLIAVNNRAGGHAGPHDARSLLDLLAGFNVPVVCAGGIGTEMDFAEVLQMGYAGAQLGTRFIATTECHASDAYKQAILNAQPEDIVLSERITGIPVAVINTPYNQRTGLRAGAIARWMLRHRKSKHFMRTVYALRSLWQLKRSSLDNAGNHDYWQAGKSVGGIKEIEPAGAIVRRFANALS